MAANEAGARRATAATDAGRTAAVACVTDLCAPEPKNSVLCSQSIPCEARKMMAWESPRGCLPAKQNAAFTGANADFMGENVTYCVEITHSVN